MINFRGVKDRIRLLLAEGWRACLGEREVLDVPPERSLIANLRRLLFGDVVARHDAKFSLAGRLATKLGVRIYGKNLAWMGGSEAAAVAWRAFPEGRDPIDDRKFVLFSLAQSVARLQGDTAECGAWNGGSSFLICRATEAEGGLKVHHIFDSFQGLSPPREADEPLEQSAYRWHRGDLACDIERTRRNLDAVNRVVFHPGWIPEKFSEVENVRFCLVHVDVDLYEPTRDAVSFFYERLVEGGVLVCDDYGSTMCPGARRACDEVLVELGAPPIIHLTTGQGIVVRRS